MAIINIFSSLYFPRLPAVKRNSNSPFKIVVFCRGDVIVTSMAANFPKDQVFTETSPGCRIEHGIKLVVSKDGDTLVEFIIYGRVSHI